LKEAEPLSISVQYYNSKKNILLVFIEKISENSKYAGSNYQSIEEMG
jgi:hypothetical protein